MDRASSDEYVSRVAWIMSTCLHRVSSAHCVLHGRDASDSDSEEGNGTSAADTVVDYCAAGGQPVLASVCSRLADEQHCCSGLQLDSS